MWGGNEKEHLSLHMVLLCYALITIKSLDVGNKITYSEILTQYIGWIPASCIFLHMSCAHPQQDVPRLWHHRWFVVWTWGIWQPTVIAARSATARLCQWVGGAVDLVSGEARRRVCKRHAQLASKHLSPVCGRIRASRILFVLTQVRFPKCGNDIAW